MSKFGDYIRNFVKSQIEDNNIQPEAAPVSSDSIKQKPDANQGITGSENMELIGAKGIYDDPLYEMQNRNNIYKSKSSRISNKILKEVSLRDWLVSTIISARVSTMTRFSRVQNNRFEPGFKIIKKDLSGDYTDTEIKEIAALEDFILNCGRRKGTPIEQRLSFTDFVKMIVRDVLTFGYIAIEKIKTRKGALHRFRPLPAESVYLIDKRVSKLQIKQTAEIARNTWKPGDNDPKQEWTVNEEDIEYYKYVQVTADNRIAEVFGDEDMVFQLFNIQNFIDSLGYSFSPLELAIGNVITHMKVSEYNSKFFTHGYAAKGVLHIMGNITDQKLKEFKRQFYNTISGSANAWRTPILAGTADMKWVPMAGNAKEMEYINYNNHIMRILCSQFQIDPVELGLDYLITNSNRGVNASTGQKEKIAFSKERGMYPILLFIEDFINNKIFPAIDEEICKKYKFVFVGYTDDTPALEINRSQAEAGLYLSMNDLLKRVGKETIDDPAANLPLNKAFWELVERNYTRAEIRQKFFKDDAAAEQQQLWYIPGDASWMQWQKMQIELANRKDQKKQIEEQKQMQMAQAQKSQEQEPTKKSKEEGVPIPSLAKNDEDDDLADADPKKEAIKSAINKINNKKSGE